MSGLAATRRRAAWRRTSSQVRIVFGGPSFEPSLATSGVGLTVSSGGGFAGAAVGGTGLLTSPGPRSEEPVQPARQSATAAASPRRPCAAAKNESVKRTIDLLG